MDIEMSESGIPVTPGTGGPTIDLELLDNGNARQTVVIGDASASAKVAPVDSVLGLSVNLTNSIIPVQVEYNLDSITIYGANNTTPKLIQTDNNGNIQVGIVGSPSVSISNFPSNQAVTGTFWQTTQPISIVSLPLPTGAATYAEQAIINTSLQSILTQLQSTELCSITQGGNTAIVDNTGDLQVDVNNFPATQAVTGTFWQATQPISGSVSIVNQLQLQPTNLIISTTGASGAAVTATLPAAGAGLSHYITAIEIHEICATAISTGSGTPTVVTTTNLPGSLSWSFGYPVTAIGVTMRDMYHPFDEPIKSSAANTTTTIVAPATTSVIWRINVHYYTGV